jgi:hypothetical protein
VCCGFGVHVPLKDPRKESTIKITTKKADKVQEREILDLQFLQDSVATDGNINERAAEFSDTKAKKVSVLILLPRGWRMIATS